MKLTALRQLRGEYGLLAPGDQFELEDKMAQHFIKSGLAYERKDQQPSEKPVKAPAEQPTKKAEPKPTKPAAK